MARRRIFSSFARRFKVSRRGGLDTRRRLTVSP